MMSEPAVNDNSTTLRPPPETTVAGLTKLLNRLLARLKEPLDPPSLSSARISAGHVRPGVRVNGHGRPLAFISALDEFEDHRRELDEYVEHFGNYVRAAADLSEQMQRELDKRGITRCPTCLGPFADPSDDSWYEGRNRLGTGTPTGGGGRGGRSSDPEWTDCPTCWGAGVVIAA
jgi:hypothetical protein